MFSNDVKRIGFACKYFHPDRSLKKKLLEEIERPLNERSTTITWLNRQTVRLIYSSRRSERAIEKSGWRKKVTWRISPADAEWQIAHAQTGVLGEAS